MPYKSQAQAGWFHTHVKQLGKKVVSDWDKATKGKHLPKYTDHKRSHYG